MARILIVEDEEKLARMLELELTYEGYETEKALDGPTGLTMALSGRFDLVTARDAVTDKVSGLDAGAEDYITKPFAIEELLARIRVSLRKRSSGGQPQSTQLTVGEICLDPESRSVTLRGEPVSLTRREFDLLQHLMEHPNRVLTREQLLSQVWGYDYAGETNAVDVYISFLRNKLGAGVIDTVRGVGYIMRR